MVKKIICSFLFVSLFIALILYTAGVRSVNFDTKFYAWVEGIVLRTNELRAYSIPEIPIYLPDLTTGNWYDIFTLGFNVWAQSINFLNIVIKVLNAFIYVIKFLIVLIQSVNTMPSIFGTATTDVAII